MRVSPKDRLLSTIRRERTDRLPVAPRHYDPAFQIASLGLPGEPEYFMTESAQPELYRVGLAALKVSTEAVLDYAAKIGFDPVFYKGVRLGLPLGVTVEFQREDRGELVLETSVYHTPAGQLGKTEKRFRDEGLRLATSHGASPSRMHEPLVKGPADLEKLAFLTDHSEPRQLISADFRDTLRIVGDRGLVFAEVPHPVMLAVEFCGLQDFLISMVADPDYARDLLALCNQVTLGHIKTVLDMGAEVIYMDGVFSTPRLISPAHFERFISPLIDGYVALLHRRGALLHLFVDGPCLAILSILRDLNVDMVSPMDPPPWGDADLGHVRKVVGERLCYMGGINAPNDLVKKNREEIAQQVRSLIAAAPDRGFILSTADSVQPGTPIENYITMIETALASGNQSKQQA